MKRLLMPATALTTLKKVAFMLFCCTVLMVFAAPAQTIQSIKADPGSNQGPPAGAILDLSGTPIPGGGNGTYQQYTVNFTAGIANTAITFAFREDPAFISFANASVVDLTADNGINLLTNGNFSGGTYTNNGNSSTPIGWTYANQYGAFSGGIAVSSPCYAINSVAVPNCWYDGAVQAYDAISQTIATNVGDTYQISFFVADNSGCSCNFSDVSTNGDTTGIGGNGIDVTVYAQAGLPPPQDTLTVTEMGLGAGTVQETSNTGSPQPGPINCTEAGGGMPQTGTCSETDAPGTMVTLTETPNPLAPNGGPSTFGGWGGACASSGMNSTCMVTISSAQNVTASFVGPPVNQSLGTDNYCSSGSPNMASTTFCPNGSNSGGGACTDPNEVVFTVEIPVLTNLTSGECVSLQVIATEVTSTGFCPASQAPYYGQNFPNNPTTTFDCRFVNSYNYGAETVNGVSGFETPLAYPYENGNSVYYNLQLEGGGGPLTPSQTPEGVFWSININPSNLPVASPFTVPAGYSGTPRLLDDPDYYNPNDAGLPYGTSYVGDSLTGCDDAMLVGSPGTPYVNGSGKNIYCQFDNDITTFFSGTVGGDPPTAGGKSKGTNDVVVAFEPTSITQGGGNTATPLTPVAPVISLSCGTGCTLSGPTITFTEGTPGIAAIAETVSPYPAPALVGWTAIIGSPVTVTNASETGNTVTLTASSFSGFVAPSVVIVSGCTTTPGYNGTFLIVSGTGGTTLTYFDNTAGLAMDPSDTCMAQAATPPVLPTGVTFDATTGVISGTPADGTAGPYPLTFTASNGVSPAPNATQSFTLMVAQAGTLTITASSPSMTYGGSVPAITPGYMGFVNGDTAASLTTPPNSPPTCSTTATSSSPVSGTPYPSTCSGAADANYSMISYVPGTVTVNQAPLTITASSSSMTYGGTVPTINPSFMGLVNGDNAGTLGVTCTTAATSTSAPGNYATSCTASAGTNYTITYVGGSVTVSAAPVTVTASSPSMTYGTAVPTITPIYGGLEGHNPATAPICSTTAMSTSAPGGSYASSCMNASDPDYTFTYSPGSVTVSAAAVVVTASSPTMTYGAAVPGITPIYTYPAGTVSSHAPATAPTCSTTATSTSLAGTYPSTCKNAGDPDYTFSYMAGAVTVVGLEISPLTMNFGNLYLGQIGVQGIILKNTTTAPITITSMTLGGGSANGDYGDLAFCPPMILKLPATLPAGKSCAIGVGILATAKVFSPTASTTYLTITDSAATQTVLLTALVTDPQVSLSPTSLSFGNQTTGTTSAAQKVTLTNSGLTPLTLTGLTISANFAFASGTTCTSSTVLSPGGTCLIYANFTPTKKGTKYSGSVTITDLTLFGKQTISLSGTGN